MLLGDATSPARHGVLLLFEVPKDRTRIDPQVAGSLGSVAIVSFKHLEDILSLKSSFAFSSGMIAVSWLAPRSRSSGVRSD